MFYIYYVTGITCFILCHLDDMSYIMSLGLHVLYYVTGITWLILCHWDNMSYIMPLG